MQQQNISITAIGSGGMAFGYSADGQSVYVPKGVANAAKIKAETTYSAKLVPNEYRPDKAALMAIMIYPHAPILPQMGAAHRAPVSDAKPVADGRDMTPGRIALDAVALVNCGGVWTCAQLIEVICGPGWRERHPNITAYVSMRLLKEFREGRMSRSEIYRDSGQVNPSAVKWSSDWKLL